MDTPDDTALEQEFNILMARAGLVVPADRRAGSVAGFKDLRRMAVLLHEQRPATSEPSNVFSLTPFIRKS
jgi:hypothetical protein